MVWRRVIQVLGGLCIGVGALSMCNNFGESVNGLLGPGMNEASMERMPAVMQDSGRAQSAALESGVYRWFLVVQGALDGVMAMLLIAAGIGLLRVMPWARRVGLAWGGYALVSSGLYVVMANRYLIPEVLATSPQPMPAGGGVFVSVLMLLMLWAFPSVLLTVLLLGGTKRVFAEAAAAPARGFTTQTPRPMTPAAPGPPAARGDAAPNAPAADVPVGPGPADAPPRVAPPSLQTWRDDPWNDADAT